jgi:hypothetical protein
MNSWINLSALWRIIVVGLICGAGLPAVFAVGLRVLATGATVHSGVAAGGTAGAGTSADASSDRIYGGNPAGLIAAALGFGVVLAGIAWGVYMVVES